MFFAPTVDYREYLLLIFATLGHAKILSNFSCKIHSLGVFSITYNANIHFGERYLTLEDAEWE